MRLSHCSDKGVFSLRKLAKALQTTREEVAWTAGFGKEAVRHQDYIQSNEAQRRLHEMVEVINRVEPRFDSLLIAYAWYRSEPLSGFSGQTAMQLVHDGRVDEVFDFIDAVDAGVHA